MSRPDRREKHRSSSRPTRIVAIALALLLVCAAAVFAGSRLNEEGPEPSNDGDASAAAARLPGSLASDPPMLGTKDLGSARAGSASERVLQLWYWGQWGSIPNVIATYDPAVVESVGAADIAGAYSQQRSFLATTRPELVDETEQQDIRLVTVRARRRDAPPQSFAFNLRRTDGEWHVIFDTLLESALATYVQTQSMSDPNEKPSYAAVRAGAQAALDFRVAHLPDGG
jgi:hypothetical protein